MAALNWRPRLISYHQTVEESKNLEVLHRQLMKSAGGSRRVSSLYSPDRAATPTNTRVLNLQLATPSVLKPKTPKPLLGRKHTLTADLFLGEEWPEHLIYYEDQWKQHVSPAPDPEEPRERLVTLERLPTPAPATNLLMRRLNRRPAKRRPFYACRSPANLSKLSHLKKTPKNARRWEYPAKGVFAKAFM